MSETKTEKTRSRAIPRLALAALFAALAAAGAFISIPLGPVPIVLQNMFALLAGLVLGPVLGAASMALFVSAGAIGAPVFSGGSGGIGVLLGPTGGYLVGYILCAFVSGLIAGAPKPGEKTRRLRIAIAAAAGMLAVYPTGLLWLARVLELEGAGRALAIGFLPYAPGDAIKATLAALAAGRLRRAASAALSR
ncbi:MAG: biotin transporter BioY [Treponema sp.]|nr:biotin transporter BioY [Treponema sp.]